MINTVLIYTNVTAETLLQGNSNLSQNINREIFKAVHKHTGTCYHTGCNCNGLEQA